MRDVDEAPLCHFRSWCVCECSPVLFLPFCSFADAPPGKTLSATSSVTYGFELACEFACICALVYVASLVSRTSSRTRQLSRPVSSRHVGPARSCGPRLRGEVPSCSPSSVSLLKLRRHALHHMPAPLGFLWAPPTRARTTMRIEAIRYGLPLYISKSPLIFSFSFSLRPFCKPSARTKESDKGQRKRGPGAIRCRRHSPKVHSFFLTFLTRMMPTANCILTFCELLKL